MGENLWMNPNMATPAFPRRGAALCLSQSPAPVKMRQPGAGMSGKNPRHCRKWCHRQAGDVISDGRRQAALRGDVLSQRQKPRSGAWAAANERIGPDPDRNRVTNLVTNEVTAGAR